MRDQPQEGGSIGKRNEEEKKGESETEKRRKTSAEGGVAEQRRTPTLAGAPVERSGEPKLGASRS